MLIGLTLVAVVLSIILLRENETVWRMVFSWWRKSAHDDSPTGSERGKNIAHNEDAVEADDDGSATPKVQANIDGASIPSFALDTAADFSSDEEDDLPPPQFPAFNSAQRASGSSQPASPSFTAPHTPSLSSLMMAPPARPNSSTSLLPPPSRSMRPPTLTPVRLHKPPQNDLRAPAMGPLPNRGPVPSSSLSVQLTTSVAQPNPRKKIALSPGHSPLDWAHLQKTHPNLAGVPGFQRVSPTMLKFHNGRKGRPAWASYQGRVYNISPYMPFHPGGEGELRRCAGQDGEKLFNEVHPWVNWDNMMEQCLVGILVSENDPRAAQSSPLEEMD